MKKSTAEKAPPEKMLRAIILFALMLSTFLAGSVFAQTPAAFNYQAVARNAGGDIISNAAVGVQFQLHQATSGGTVVYAETHTPITNAWGLFSVQVGNGIPLIGTLANVDWSLGPYFLEVGLDTAGGINYTSMGNEKLLSVPYALATGGDGYWQANGDDIQNTNSGRIGIGTTTPGTMADTTARIEIADEDGANSDLLIRTAGSGAPAIILATQNGTLTAPLAVDPDAVVGIIDAMYYKGSSYGTSSRISMQADGTTNGTDNPGAINIQTTPAGSTIPLTRMMVTSSGLVGIGTISPLKPLDVNGDALINGLTIGRGNNGNDYSTALGFEALIYNNGGTGTAIGSGALSDNGVGFNNTATGKDALNRPKYSIYTAGSGNTAIGSSALANFKHVNNTAAGSNALFHNTLGQYNTALGSDALFNSTGILSTAVGTRALYSSKASYNTALGYEAGYSLLYGQYNLAIGSEALKLNNSGSNNTAVGYSALDNNTSGSSNTAIGYGANVAYDTLTNAAAIGYNAQVGANNALVLGGTGVDGVNVGMGTTTPAASAILDVSSTEQGFLPPRMTSIERDDIPDPVAGLVIFNTFSNQLNVYNGYTWRTTSGAPASYNPIPNELIPAVGQPFQGGIVAYILTPEDSAFYDPVIKRGIIVAPFDQSPGIKWGAANRNYFGPSYVGAGRKNTNTILDWTDEENYAAKLCGDLQLNGYDDWHLPSLTELQKVLANQNQIGGFVTQEDILIVFNNGTYQILAPATVKSYWTSSEPGAEQDIRPPPSSSWYSGISLGTVFTALMTFVPLSNCIPIEFSADGTPVSGLDNFEWKDCAVDIVQTSLSPPGLGKLQKQAFNFTKRQKKMDKVFSRGEKLFAFTKAIYNYEDQPSFALIDYSGNPRSARVLDLQIRGTDVFIQNPNPIISVSAPYWQQKGVNKSVRAVRYFNIDATDPCTDGMQNGDETGVDCGGQFCQPCICTDNYLQLTLVLDTYPGETSWFITDSTGAVVAATDGTCGSFAPGSTVTEQICLVDGCYNFIMLDAQGNGLLGGSYSLTNGSCHTYAAGGSFGYSDTTSFCIDRTLGTCDDGIQNGNEECVDCGGSYCDPCPGCNDGIQNGSETGVDCGGPDCIPCHCSDGIQNGNETSVDCGGDCPTCSCSDGIQNGNETGVDCGGPDCIPCHCSDGIKNNGELLIDCGGSCPNACTVQNALDLGQAPMQIFEAGYPLDSLYGKTYKGGLIFYLDISDGSGMIATPGDLSISAEWGCVGFDLPNAELLDDGSQNTLDITLACTNSVFAAKLCADFSWNWSTDWYLPSKNELDSMWANLADPDGDGQTTGVFDPNNLGQFYSACYWSSTEISNNNAWSRHFGNGAQIDTVKSAQIHVRAIKSFCYECCDDGIQNGDETGVDCGGYSCVPCGTHCADGIHNGAEIGIDCGGPCTPCADLCNDGILNGDETGIDCGGSCIPCSNLCGDGILNGDETGIDCGGSCIPCTSLCADGILNGDETGIDCGGSCDDCTTLCSDGIQNGDETGVDCGGSCGPCTDLCNDGILNSDESSIDCGGAFCGGNTIYLAMDLGEYPDLVNWSLVELPNTPIASGVGTIGDTVLTFCLPDGQYRLIFNDDTCNTYAVCGTAIDQVGLFGTATNLWYVPVFDGPSDTLDFILPIGTCSDGVQNGSETGVDCGGASCVDCANLCNDGIQNGDETGVDCGGSCIPCYCNDGIQNGDETGIDCGGSCGLCADLCSDGIQNGDETGVDCGGSYCVPCSCSDGVRNNDEELIDCGGSCTPCMYQDSLDAGVTALELFQAGAPLDALYGLSYQGGLIFYLDTLNGSGMIAAPADQSTAAKWGCQGIDIPTGDAMGNGAQNTVDIIAAACTDPSIAASICAGLVLNGSDDWHLPSKDELATMYTNMNETGGFAGSKYWSSTEFNGNDNYVWSQDFGPSGLIEGYFRSEAHHVRAVRAFCIDCCTDQVKNNGEVGVDCGGLNCESCAALCSDGIQNGDETGVDCGGSSCGGNSAVLTIKFDDYPEETSWSLTKGATTLFSGGPYNGEPAGSTITIPLCLPDTCVDFTFSDLYGDGICCGGGNGSYNLSLIGWGVLVSGTEFEYSETTSICLPAGTCSDGIQNGPETDVDCGGIACIACPTCSDGLLNGDEVYVDCGGTSCASCLVQVRLDEGETPLQIYQSDNTLLDSLYGKTYAGGLIAYLNTSDGSGLVAAPTDYLVSYTKWGCHGTSINGADGTAIGTGQQNTMDIEAECTTLVTAADICAHLTLNTFSDWFLPSKDELDQVWTNLAANDLGGFQVNYYWSSTEVNANSAWKQDLGDGYQNSLSGKDEMISMRPVRAFSMCSDGVLNGDETDVDCGGTLCLPCATCNDGILNGEELLVDCGGTSCIPCLVQGRLDGGETPLEIYRSNHTLLDSLYGKTYQGGLIAYLNTTTGSGLVAAPTDQSTGAVWGCQNDSINGAGGTVIGSGAQNTLDIVEDCATVGIAAYICSDLTLNTYSDWFLPSLVELIQLRQNLHLKGSGDFTNDLYWSSTQYNTGVAVIQNYTDGVWGYADKVSNYHVRAVRAFGSVAPVMNSTTAASGITESSAISGGVVSSNGGALVTARGVCWGPSFNTSIADSFTTDGAGIGSYSSSITGLLPNTSYYVRAYATNSVGTSYAFPILFTTLPPVPTCSDGILNQDETYVDCGGASCAPCTVQQRLDGGETPLQIYQSDNSLLGSLYGKIYQGGLIAYLNTTTGAGFVAAASDQSAGAQWGCDGVLIAGADGWAIGTGAQNTIDIEVGCTTPGIAADLCANLSLNTFSDWFLPSLDELNQLYQNLHLNADGGFTSTYYWSSTESNIGVAGVQNFADGGYSGAVKFAGYRVRAVRAF